MMRPIVAMLLSLAVAGCASLPDRTPVLPESREGLADAWVMHGRIGLRSDEQSLSGNLRWQHSAESDELFMTSPLGQGVARIVRDASGVTLDLPNQPARHAPDAEALTREALGYTLPVAGLVWWIQARPDPQRPFEATRDAAGRLRQLKQDGWVIDYLQYPPDTTARPQKLVVTRAGLEIRLVADRWQ